MDIIIRKGEKSDISKIVHFQVAMALETEELQLDESTVHKGVEAVFNDDAKGSYFIAEIEGEAIASLMITFEWSDWRNRMVWWIQSVYVKKEHRGIGVFKQLYLHIKNLVENDSKLGGIRLYVDNTNLAAQQVYDRIGMNGDHYKVFEWMEQ